MYTINATVETSPVKIKRKALGLRQYQLARLAGMSPGTLVAIERYGWIPMWETRRKLAKALGVTQDDLWPGINDDQDPPAPVAVVNDLN